MKEQKDILKQIDHRDGMTVPEGYFADFATRMAQSLEKTPFEESKAAPVMPRTFWQRVRPYVYMAAMFAGVWCMLKMFTMMSGDKGTDLSPAVAEAMGNEVFVNDYVLDDINQWDLYDQMMEEGIDVNAFCDSIDQLYAINPNELESL